MEKSSIGLIGQVYYDEVNDRTKAFFPKLLTSVEEVRRYQDMFLSEARGTRLSLRLVVRGLENILLSTLTRPHAGHMMTREAIIPIDVDGDLGTKIVYYGWNDNTRMTNCSHRVQEEDLLRRVLERKTTGDHDCSNYVVDFSKRAAQVDISDIFRLLDIYRRAFSSYLFEFTYESVCDMLMSNWVSLVRHRVTEEIVAVAMGEMVKVDIGGEEMQICELSEVATLPSFQRRGLAHLAFGRLCRELDDANVRVVFSETCATSYGMAAVAHDNGFRSCGRLEKHCVISSPCSDVVQGDPYGDLVVFARPPR